ncbi:MAG: hypothetical protein AB4352_20860 [Hormoscilla sp.]
MLSTTVNSLKQAALPLKKALSKLALVGATLLFAAAAVLGVTAPTALAAEIETLHGLYVSESTVTIIVTSTGCTKKEDFIVVSDKSQPTTATFIRLVPDPCKAAPRPYRIQFSFEEVGAKDFKVANTFDPIPGW